MEYHKALNFFEEDWTDIGDQAYYKFPSDIGSIKNTTGAEVLASQPVALDYGAFMAINYIHLSNYYRFVGNSAASTVYLL